MPKGFSKRLPVPLLKPFGHPMPLLYLRDTQTEVGGTALFAEDLRHHSASHIGNILPGRNQQYGSL